MASILFDHPIFVQRKRFIDEIASLDDTFDLLEEWPDDQRGLAYDTLLRACREAAAGRFPANAVAENLSRFLKKAGVLAEVEDVPNFARVTSNRSIGGT